MIPRVSQLQAENRKREMLELSVNATQKLAFFYFPLFCFLMIVAGEFMTTLFTNEYAASTAIFRVNLFALPLFSLVVDPVTRAFPVAGRFLLKVRILICIVLVAVFWTGLGRLGLLEMISIVVAAVLFEKLMSAWISVRMLEARPGDVVMLRTIGKTAASAVAAGGVLLAFYLMAADALMEASVGFSRRILVMFDISRAAEFFGGCVFLGVCLAIYGAAYLLVANRIGAIAPEDREKFGRLLRRVFQPRAAETKAAL
jgi:O-antigen/teichoic acid export membrane protein